VQQRRRAEVSYHNWPLLRFLVSNENKRFHGGTTRQRVMHPSTAVSQLLWPDKDREEWFSLRENHEKVLGFGLHQLRNRCRVRVHSTRCWVCGRHGTLETHDGDLPLETISSRVSELNLLRTSADAFPVVGGRCTGRARRCKAKQGRRGKTAPTCGYLLLQ
jgi:hypothetical protein